MAIELKKVSAADYGFLYNLLKEKEPLQNISHKEMPTWEQHVKFNEKTPYVYDWVILSNGQKVGRINIEIIYPKRKETYYEVGVHIIKKYHSMGYGTAAIKKVKKLVKGILLANVAPHNIPSQLFFEKHGFNVVQHTYRYD